MDHAFHKMITATVLSIACVTAQAAMQTVTDPTGQSDYEVMYDDEDTGLFGTPFLQNNTLFFVPNNFASTSLNGAGEQIVNDTVQLILKATTPGFTFDEFNLLERGDYRLNGAGASVDVDGQISVFDPDNPFNFAADFLNVSSDLTINDGDLHNWVGTTTIDQDDNWMGGASVVNLTLENLLISNTSAMNSSAFIEKKFAGVLVSVNGSPVPVPAAFWLFGSALLGLAGLKKKR